jgi:hypothetical protein
MSACRLHLESNKASGLADAHWSDARVHSP